MPQRLRVAAGSERATRTSYRSVGGETSGVVLDFGSAKRRRLFGEVAPSRAASVVRSAVSQVAPNGGVSLALARPWPNPRLENRLTLLVLQLWLDELRDWEQSLAGLDPSLLAPILRALDEGKLALLHSDQRHSLGTVRLADLLRCAGHALEREARRLRGDAVD